VSLPPDLPDPLTGPLTEVHEVNIKPPAETKKQSGRLSSSQGPSHHYYLIGMVLCFFGSMMVLMYLCYGKSSKKRKFDD